MLRTSVFAGPSQLFRFTSRFFSGKLHIIGLAFALILVLSRGAAGQAADEQGFKPYGSYSGTNIDQVNLQNGHLELRIPMVSYPQRGGKLRLSFIARYTNSIWNERTDCVPTTSICFHIWEGGTQGVVTAVEQAPPGLWSQHVDPPNCQLSCTLMAWAVQMPDQSNHALGSIGGTVLESLDATGIKADTSSNTIIFSDGTRYLNLNSGTPILEDSNGNQIVFNMGTPGSIIDTLGRNIPWAGIATSDFTGCTGPLSVASASIWSVPGANGSLNTFKFCMVNVKVFTNHWAGKTSTPTQQYIEPNGNVSMIQSIILPDNTAWTFEYSQPDTNGVNWGDLVRVTVPTGGTIAYTWSHPQGCHNVTNKPATTSGHVDMRTVDAKDGLGPQIWLYQGNTVTDPTGNDTVHIFTDLTGCSIYETQTQYFAGTGSGRTLLKTITTDFSWSGNPNIPLPPFNNGPAAINVVPIRITTSWPSGQVRKTEMAYDGGFTFNNPSNTGSFHGIYGKRTSGQEFDYGSGAPGPLLKTTSTSYLWQSASGASYLTQNVLDVPTQVSVLNPAGGGSLTTFAYDESLPGSSGVTTSHDGAPSNGNVRGNLTSISSWLNGTAVSTASCPVSASNTFVITTKNYLDTGVISQQTDACHHTTTYQYAITPYAGAFVTQACDALNHCSTTGYDINTGQTTSVVDPNSKQTTFGYDNFGRLTSVNYPDGGQLVGNYPDPVTVEVKQLQNATTGIWTDSFSYFDGFLRRKQTRLVDPEGDVFKETTYDPLERVATATNPHRNVAATTDGTTTNHYDAFGRITQVQQPDGNSIFTQYTDPGVVILTDETGRQRREVSDALGRLVQVDEPGDGSNGTQASTTLLVSGNLQSKTISATATPATGTVQITGTEHSTTVNNPPPGGGGGGGCSTATPTQGTGGGQGITTPVVGCAVSPGPGGAVTTTVYDAGTVNVVVNGKTYSASFGQGVTFSSIASTLVGLINSPTTPDPYVTADIPNTTATAVTLRLTAKASGSGGNSITLSSSFTWDSTDFPNPPSGPGPSFTSSVSGATLAGGADAPRNAQVIVDAGTVTVQVGTFSATSCFSGAFTPPPGCPRGYKGTTSDIAADLAAALTAQNPPFTATSNGASINLLYKTVGAAGNLNVTIPPPTWDSTDFASSSFSVSGSALSGGSDPYAPGIAHPYSTFYSYDILNNLSRVEQHGNSSDPGQWRVRTFVYDSMSRMMQSTNPEAGAIIYSYDADGNEIARQDARSVTASSAYDQLHRLLQRSFSDSTPAASFSYDQASAWGVTLSNTIGRLSSTGAANGTAGSVFSYDPMGRVANEWVCLPSNCGNGSYPISALYDLAGHMTSLTYPSGRTVTTAYNSPGRAINSAFSNFAGQAANYAYYTVPQTTTAATWGYNPDGSLHLGAFGNGVQESYSYNNRSQLSAISAAGLGQTWMSKTYSFYDSNGNNNGTILNIMDGLNTGRNQFYSYDLLNRVISGYQQDGSFNQTFTYDPWANMKTSGTSNFNPVYDGNNRIQGAGSTCTAANAYCYDAAGNMLNDGFHQYIYDGDSRITSVDGTGATYTYGAAGERVRKNTGGNSTEYIYFGPSVVAERDAASGNWSDYIFFNGHRIAKSDQNDIYIRTLGTVCANCGWQWEEFHFALPTSHPLYHYVIQTGDKLFVRQHETAGTRAGVGLGFTDGTYTGATLVDQDGNPAADDTVTVGWHYRQFNLSAYAGKSIGDVFLVTDGSTAAGQWSASYDDFAMVGADGTVRPVYTRENAAALTQAGTSGQTGVSSSIVVGTATPTDAASRTYYYHNDQIGSARLMTSGGGWPVWQGTFTAFGQEISPQITNNHYKFTGKERGEASEGGLDYFGARYYSSTMGRWMTPDWSATPTPVPYARLADPQSLNLYGYVEDDPLSKTDMDGHFQMAPASPSGSCAGGDNGDACGTSNKQSCGQGASSVCADIPENTMGAPADPSKKFTQDEQGNVMCTGNCQSAVAMTVAAGQEADPSVTIYAGPVVGTISPTSGLTASLQAVPSLGATIDVTVPKPDDSKGPTTSVSTNTPGASLAVNFQEGKPTSVTGSVGVVVGPKFADKIPINVNGAQPLVQRLGEAIKSMYQAAAEPTLDPTLSD